MRGRRRRSRRSSSRPRRPNNNSDSANLARKRENTKVRENDLWGCTVGISTVHPQSLLSRSFARSRFRARFREPSMIQPEPYHFAIQTSKGADFRPRLSYFTASDSLIDDLHSGRDGEPEGRGGEDPSAPHIAQCQGPLVPRPFDDLDPPWETVAPTEGDRRLAEGEGRVAGVELDDVPAT